MIEIPNKMKVQISKHAKVLVIEDNGRRNAWFREHLPVENTTYATNPQDAVIAVNHAEYNVIFLDHDAINIMWTEEDKNPSVSTFIDAVRQLQHLEFAGSVLIHSFNAPGAERFKHMLGRHAQVHIAKFGTFSIEVV